MFGYVIVNKEELKIKEFNVYRMYYCGLCRELKDKYGLKGQITVNYDMTFLGLLLDGLYDCEQYYSQCRCAAHPFCKQNVLRNEFLAYAADMNILLTYLKCQDDWVDDKKLLKKTEGALLKKAYKKVLEKYPEKTKKIIEELDNLSKCEKENDQDFDKVSGHFGKIMSELFAYKDDEWKPYLERMGFFMGKFIYILDAHCDYDEDVKKSRYNLLKSINNDREQVSGMLTMMMAECSANYEMLPIVENTDLLNNIVYSGIWSAFEYKEAKDFRKAEKIEKKAEKKAEKQNGAKEDESEKQ